MGPAGALLRSLGEAMQPGEGETARVCWHSAARTGSANCSQLVLRNGLRL